MKGIWNRFIEEKGQDMVEFALTAGILLTLLFSFFDAGRAFYVKNSLTYAASRAARYGIVHPSDLSGIAEIARENLIGVPPEEASVSVSVTSEEVRVTISYHFDFIFSMFAPGGVTLVGYTSMQRL
jgi:Flp pilus assembly protein TadG